MNVLYIITQAGGGGAQNYVLALARHFKGGMAAGAEDTKLFNEAEECGVAAHPLLHLKRAVSPWHDLLAVWEIRQLIKFLRPDIVHLNSTKAGILGSFAAIGLKTKIVFTAHGFIFNEPMGAAAKNFYLALEKTASDFRDLIITVSEADRQAALKYNLARPEKIVAIRNGIGPIDFFSRDEARKILKLDPQNFIFGTVANFYKTKGLDMLVKAVALLPGEIKSTVQFAIIGDGPERQKLESGIMNYGLGNNILLLGKAANAKKYLKAFDGFILPSRKEGFPYALLEAMRAGLPIIATDAGGNREALGDAGILVKPEDPQNLYSAITTLIQESMLVKTLGQKALERSGLFTEEKMFQETKEAYGALAKKNSKTPYF